MAPETRSQSRREGLLTRETSFSTSTSANATAISFSQPRHTSRTNNPSTNKKDGSVRPPSFVIDLSLPPEQRYLEVCAAFRDDMRNLTSLFDEVVGGITQIISNQLLRKLCAVLLRKVYDKEENAELRGISKATGVEMYLLVCFNVLLDLFMGCSSGAARVGNASAGNEDGTKMLHFRTLDWGMPALRKVIVQLEYKESQSGPIIARSITYAGYVGVLTGAREGLSMSLNFRPTHDNKTSFRANFQYYGHHLLVLLGMRRSISSTLRSFLLPSSSQRKRGLQSHVSKTSADLNYSYALRRLGGKGLKSSSMPLTTTACYLCFSNGQETTVIEKDRITARLRSDTDFIIVTNADFTSSIEGSGDADTTGTDEAQTKDFTVLLDELAEDAKDRKQCAEQNWKRMCLARSKSHGSHSKDVLSGIARLMDAQDVVELVQKYPTTNECTHFACVMDPSDGDIKWCRFWRKPVGAQWVRAHMSEGW